MRTRCRFGSKRRLVATIEWLRLLPKPGPFPQETQTLDMAGAVYRGSRSSVRGIVPLREEAFADLRCRALRPRGLRRGRREAGYDGHVGPDRRRRETAGAAARPGAEEPRQERVAIHTQRCPVEAARRDRRGSAARARNAR